MEDVRRAGLGETRCERSGVFPKWSRGEHLLFPAVMSDNTCEALPSRDAHPSLRVQGVHGGQLHTQATLTTPVADL